MLNETIFNQIKYSHLTFTVLIFDVFFKREFMCRRVNFIVYIGSSASTTVFKACLATHLVINKMFKNFNKLNLIAKYFPVGEKVVGCFYNID